MSSLNETDWLRSNAPSLLMAMAFAVSIPFVVMSCSVGHDNSARRDVLTRGIGGDPESLDPHLFRSTQAGNVLRDLGEGLIGLTANGDLTQGVAHSWDISDDGKTYLFHIRREARWSNGEPLTAHDFEKSFRRLADPKTASPSGEKGMPIKNFRRVLNGELPPYLVAVNALDESTLRIELESPTPYFLQLLTHPSMFPVYLDDSVARAGPAIAGYPRISNGAYKLADHYPAASISLVRNKEYWDTENTWFDRVIYLVADPAGEVARYRSGEIDVTSSIDSSIFLKMKTDRPCEVRVAPQLGVYYYGFNLTRPPFRSNSDLRQALSMAIDRDLLVSTITKRGEMPAYSFVPPGIDGFDPTPLPFKYLSKNEREKQARQLYNTAGLNMDSPFELELRFNTLGGHERTALAIKSMWKEVLGIETTLVKEDFKVFLSNVTAMDETEVFRLSWNGEYKDAYTFLQLFETGNPNNLTGYSNSRVDTLILRAAEAQDMADRGAILEEAEKIALADHPVIPIYFFVNKHLIQPDIAGWEPNSLDIHPSKYLSRVVGRTASCD